MSTITYFHGKIRKYHHFFVKRNALSGPVPVYYRHNSVSYKYPGYPFHSLISKINSSIPGFGQIYYLEDVSS